MLRPFKGQKENWKPTPTYAPLNSIDDFTIFKHDPEQKTDTVIRLEGFFGRLFNRITILTKVRLNLFQTHRNTAVQKIQFTSSLNKMDSSFSMWWWGILTVTVGDAEFFDFTLENKNLYFCCLRHIVNKM